MNIQHLVRMANSIAEFFASMPERQEAIDGIALHLRRFWEPRMRRQLLAHIDQQGGSGLHPLVLEALREQRA